jgi:predicted  nucleic acid-binding Zn-ribbon protein
VDRNVIEEQIKEEEKRLKDLHKDLSKLENKNDDLHKDIEKYEKKIVEAEEDIVDNLETQDDKQIEIRNQTKVVERLIKDLNSIGKN